MVVGMESVQVDATGRRLALKRAGSGGPTVIFETGLGAESEEWEPVFQAVSEFTSVCLYDRANRGHSDPAPRPRSALDSAADLHALLAAAGILRPVVLVGHSLGGLIVRLYAYHHPQDVAGLVLVDPMHEDQFDRLGPLFPQPALGETITSTQTRDFWTEGWRDPARNAEGVDFPASQAQAQAISSLGDIPMLVLTAGAYSHEAPREPAARQLAARLQRLWQEMHQELLDQSSHAAHTLVETSGHFIQREQPEVIVAAVRQMLDIVRNRTSAPAGSGCRP